MLARAILAAAALALISGNASHVVVGDVGRHAVRPGDSWVSLGARFGVPAATLAEMNERRVNSALRKGEVIAIDARHIAPVTSDTAIIINVPQRMLFFYRDGGLAAHYPIAVGRHDWPTPLGTFQVREREENPTWDVPVSIQEEMRREGARVLTKVPPGPANPLGRHWIGLTIPGVGIHGTNVPTSIYRSTTHGCIRMHPDDVAALFAQVKVGDTGRIVYEPVVAAVTDDGRMFLEVHPDFYRKAPRLLARARDTLQAAGLLDRVQADDIAREVRDRRGIAVELPAAAK